MFIISLIIIHVASQYTQLSDIILQSTSCQYLTKIDFLELNQANPKYTSTFTINEPHYAVDLYVDFYLIGQYLDQTITIQVDTLQFQELIIQYDYSIPFCNNGESSQLYTYYNTFTHFQKELQLTIQVNGFILGIRNIQIYPLQCHSTCTQCVGPEQNQCRSCGYGAQLSRKTNQCKCTSSIPYLQNNQCVNKCSNDRYYDGIQCQIDTKIINLQEYFWIDYNLQGWNIIENGIITQMIDKIYIGMNNKIIGLFTSSQLINFKFNNQIDFIRIRMDIYIYSSTKQPQIILIVDKISQIAIPLHNYTVTGSDGYIVYHIDEIMDANLNANITIKLNTDTITRWGINQVVLNSINCQENCQQCSSRIKCNLCNSGYFKYQGTCVTSCPKFSTQINTDCQDFSEQYVSTDVLLRAFTDNSIKNFALNNNYNILSMKQNKYGTYYNGNRYFGGLKDNGNQFFQKTFKQLLPHFGFILEFKVMPFEFQTEGSINDLKFSYDQSNLKQIYFDLDTEKEIREEFYHTDDQLILTLFSVPAQGIYFSFGIRDFNLMIKRCYPLCKKCSGYQSKECSEWIVEPNSNSNLQTCNNGFIFNLQQQKCALCPIGCSKCADEFTCLTCDKNFIQQGSGCHCQNGYIDEFTQDCIINS